MEDFVPTNQTPKLPIIADIRRSIDPRLLKYLSPSDRTLAEEALSPAGLQPFTEKDLPPLVLEKFRERDGSVGKLVLVDKRNPGGVDTTENLAHFVNSVRAITDQVAPGAPVAGQQAVTFDIYQAILHDGPRVTGFALIFVVLLVTVLFRNVRTIGLSLTALGLGIVWYAGIILGWGIKLNFLSFIALPITFGIGIDYGVNIFQRFREEPGAGILDVIGGSGGAVILCSLTTIFGYSSLLMAGNRAFVNFGLLAVLGEITCVSAAVIALPAFLRVLARKLPPPRLEYQSVG